MRIWGLKNGVEAAPLGRGMGLLPEQLLYTAGTVGEWAGLGEAKVENAVSNRHR